MVAGRARGVRVPTDVRRGADPADGRGPGRHRPRLGAGPARARERGARRTAGGRDVRRAERDARLRRRRPGRHLVEAGERLAGLWQAHGLDVPPYAGCFRSGYLDICPTSVQATPLDHIDDVQPLRPVADAGLAGRRPRSRSSTSRWARSSSGRTCCATSWPAWRRCRSASSWPSARGRTRARWASSPARAGRAVGRPARGARPLRGGRVARRLRHLPRRPGARAAPALPAPGRRPVPQRRGRGPGRGLAGARAGRR